MRRIFELGGVIAGVVLIIFGVAAIVMGVNARTEVRDAIAEQRITATPDAAEITNGKLEPNQAITTGAEARAFADIIEFRALEATGERRYAEMGRFLTESGEETNDEAAAAKTPEGRPVENGARNICVTQTALATALNVSYMAEQLALSRRSWPGGAGSTWRRPRRDRASWRSRRISPSSAQRTGGRSSGWWRRQASPAGTRVHS